MQIDLRLPALRRRRASLEAQLREWRNVLHSIREGRISGEDGPVMSSTAILIQDAQQEFDELDYVIEFFDDRRMMVSWFDRWQLLLLVAAIALFLFLTVQGVNQWMH